MIGDQLSAIRCVGAIMVDDAGKILLIQRGHEPGRWLWSLPGGRVEPGETDHQAVVREMVEEVALIVRPRALAGVARRPASAGEFVIYDYRCDVIAGVPTAGSDAAAVRWVDRAEFEALDAAGRLTDGLAQTLRGWHALPWE